MPRLIDWLPNAVVYLFPSVESAERGDAAGGTGFLLGTTGLTMNSVPADQIYVATNSHVVREGIGNAPKVRINDLAGSYEVLDQPREAWIHHMAADDLAILPIDFATSLRLGLYKERVIPETWFLTREDMEKHHIGLGDEVFFLGRFAVHQGRTRNIPTARFGYIALMPEEPILNTQTGIRQESFLIESRSLSGYSGSPVFLYVLSGAWRGPGQPQVHGTTTIFLLGVDWGHIDNHVRVLGENKEPLEERWWVRQNSGMMGVVPAWKLRELLHDPEVVARRERDARDWVQSNNVPAKFSTDVSQSIAESNSNASSHN